MSKEGRVRGGRGSCDKSASGVPYSTITRRERSRKLAQKRRDIYKQIMDDMTDVMPFPKDVVAQLDYNSRLRLTICFFRTKAMLKAEGEENPGPEDSRPGGCSELPGGEGEGVAASNMQVARPASLFKPGMLQELMCEALDGFLMMTQLDGTIIFLSESIHKHLGLFQSEHIGINMYDLILDEDHEEVQQRISEADDRSVKRKSKHGATDVSFFCRMKCSRFKLPNTASKSPGFKLVYVSGTLKVAGNEPFLACVVRPVSAPAVLELRMEGNMFVAHYSMENMACIYFDGRLRHLLGYSKDDFIGKTPFDFQHHDDLETTLECSRQVQATGEGVSGYYRFLNRFGEYIWIQSRAVVAFDSRSGKPLHIVCTSYVISKEDGTKDLLLRQAIASGQSEFIEKTLAPENPFALKKQADGKNGTHPRSRDDELSPTLLSRLKHKEPINGRRLEPDSGDRHSSGTDSNSSSSSSKGSKPMSLLYSMLAGGKVSLPKTDATTKSDRDSTTANSMQVGEATENRPCTSQQTNVSPRLKNFEMEDGYLLDSTVLSNESSPYNPSSVQHEDSQAGKSICTMSSSDRTPSGSDLGYYSESSSSLRGRLVSTFTGYESETSSYVCDAGADSSPQTNPYSPDYPLSVLSSDGSMTSHISFLTASPSESHSQSQFQNPSSVHSSTESPIYEYDFSGGYAQQSPGNQSVNSEQSDLTPGSIQKGSEINPQQQWSPSSITSSPQQHSPANITVNGQNPTNYGGQRGLAYAKMDPAMMSANLATLSPQGSPGSRFINRSSPSMLGHHTGPTSSTSLLLSDIYITSVSDPSPRASIQALHTSVHPTNSAVSVSDLPQLTVEDLKMLDAFEQQSKEEDQFGQLLYQQTALSCRGTMMM